MIEFKALNKPRVAILLNNQVEVTFTCNRSVVRQIEDLGDKELNVVVKEYREKRSLSQNAYFWKLVNEIAIKLDRSKEAVYRSYIKDYGLFEFLPIRNDAVNAFMNKWSKNGLGWFCEDLGESKLNGYTKLAAYYGSSTYNTQEMKRLIDAVIYDCEELGISTMPLSEIMLLKNDND